MGLNKKCEEVSPDGQICVRSGIHAKHIVGLGSNLVAWPNASYRRLPKPMKPSQMSGLVKAMRR